MNEKNKKLVCNLYTAEIVLLAASAVINIAAMMGAVQIKIANLIAVLMMVASVFITNKITKLEDGKRSGSIYVVSVVIGIAWFITYIAMWFY